MTERSGGRECSEQSGASEQVSGASERANGRVSGPVLTSRFMALLNRSATGLFRKAFVNILSFLSSIFFVSKEDFFSEKKDHNAAFLVIFSFFIA